jgi:signal transduction histidine kinase
MKKRDVYRLALVGAVVVVLLNTFFAAHAIRNVFNSQEWLSHTQNVIIATEQLLARVRSAESASRGFVLTDSPDSEQQYNLATGRVEESIRQLQELTLDNPAQQRNIAELRSRVAAKMAVLETSMAERRGHPKGAIDAELIASIINDTPDRVENVQTALHNMLAEENRLLDQRKEEARIARREVWVTFIVASLLDFVLLVAAFEFLLRLSVEREIIAENAEKIASLNEALTGVNAELEDRVAQRTQLLEQRTRELAFSNQELEAFSYSVSHDLRAPLRTIDGFSLALQEDFADKLNVEGNDYIVRVRNGVQRMGTLIDALLQLSRVTRTELQSEDVDLSQLATVVFNELQSVEPSRRVTFIAQPGVHVKGDARLLRIALENLIGNAWKFTSKVSDPKIEFGSAPAADIHGVAPGHTVYFVKDNGAGFDMQYVDRLFTAFQRLHGDRDFKGSGIGLATVSRIIRRHHGTIGAESEVGRGARFFFTLAGGTSVG